MQAEHKITLGLTAREAQAALSALELLRDTLETAQLVPPPALFGAARFGALLQVTGDKGARDMIARSRHVAAPAGDLVDVDTAEDLAALIRVS